MSSAKIARQLAAKILKIGINRVWIDPESLSKATSVVSRDEVRKLIREGKIKKRPLKSYTTFRSRRRKRKNVGSRKGTRIHRKELWIVKIRALRKYLKYLRKRRYIDAKTYRELYKLSKGNVFRNTSHLKLYIEKHNLSRRV